MSRKQMAGPNPWVDRYLEALEPGEIQRRAQVRGVPVPDLTSWPVESACAEVKRALSRVNLMTDQVESIIRTLIETAADHAALVYPTPTAVLHALYRQTHIATPQMPVFLTGLSGVGKSRLRWALRRILAGNRTVVADEAHPAIPLIDYRECEIGQQRSIGAALSPLAGPEIAAGKVKVNQARISADVARWLGLSGTCLFGVDESQFMAQSHEASTLITRTLLAYADIGVPWYFVANYSLGWKLLRRPSEAVRRLLGRPVVLYPDLPNSADWEALLAEYQLVLGPVLEINLEKERAQIWNLCAGLKGELVMLLVQAYRVARVAGARKISWIHVENAFDSLEFFSSRRDINLLVAHAGQGVALRQDLACPFESNAMGARSVQYAGFLRAARQQAVAQAEVRAAMTGEEREALEAIQCTNEASKTQTAAVIPLPKRKRRNLESLIEAGQAMRNARKQRAID